MNQTTLRTANQKRYAEWVNGGEVPLSFRELELTGAAGEAFNELRKLERVTAGSGRRRRGHRRSSGRTGRCPDLC